MKNNLQSLTVDKIFKLKGQKIDRKNYKYILHEKASRLIETFSAIGVGYTGIDVCDPTNLLEELASDTGKTIQELNNDVVFSSVDLNFFSSLRNYRVNPKRNFVPSGPLVSCLEKISIDISYGDLKPSINYFETSHLNITDETGDKIDFVIMEIEEDGDRKMIKMGAMCASSAAITRSEPFMVGDSINSKKRQDGWDSSMEEVSKLSDFFSGLGGKIARKDYVDQKDDKLFNIFLNLLIYVTNPNEEFKTQYNQFSKNNKEKQRQEQEYTKQGFIKIGLDADFIRLVKEQEVGVVGHWRNQPIGEGRLDRKWIFIKPHSRVIKNNYLDQRN